MDKLAEIKARHVDSELGGYQHHEDVADDCHRDRAWLLAEVEQLRNKEPPHCPTCECAGATHGNP